MESLSIQVKSLNNRYLDIKSRLPREYGFMETRLMDEIKKVIHRGTVEMSIGRGGHAAAESTRAIFNHSLAKQYQRTLLTAKKRLRLAGEVTLSQILSLPDLWMPLKKRMSWQTQWRFVRGGLRECLKKLDRMRRREGLALKRVILTYLKSFESEVADLMKLKREMNSDYEDRLKKRMGRLMPENQLDPQRMAQEVAFLIDRSDISEELDRLKVHIQHFRSIIGSQGPIGKNLDFLIQEMHREVNTINAKVQNIKFSARKIRCKSLLEKIREQIQNVE